MQLYDAFKNETANIYAMTYGNLECKYSHQIFVCYKVKISDKHTSPCVLQVKTSKSEYELSDVGQTYMDLYGDVGFTNSFVAFLDCRLEIKVLPEVFEKMYKEGFFSIWKPESPLKYFLQGKRKGGNSGYLLVFRVYKINNPVPDILLKNNSRNSFSKLIKPYDADIAEPVISNIEFSDMKLRIISLLSAGGWLLDKYDYEYHVPYTAYQSTVDSIDYKDEEEFQVEVEKSSVLNAIKIEDSPVERTCKSKHGSYQNYIRNPEVSKRAIALTNFCCEIDNSHMHFISQATKHNYVEAHHLIPMEFQDDFETSIDVEANIVSLCVVCHKKLHHAIFKDKKEVLKKLYLQRINRLEKCGISISLEKLYSYYV